MFKRNFNKMFKSFTLIAFAINAGVALAKPEAKGAKMNLELLKNRDEISTLMMAPQTMVAFQGVYKGTITPFNFEKDNESFPSVMVFSFEGSLEPTFIDGKYHVYLFNDKGFKLSHISGVGDLNKEIKVDVEQANKENIIFSDNSCNASYFHLFKQNRDEIVGDYYSLLNGNFEKIGAIELSKQ